MEATKDESLGGQFQGSQRGQGKTDRESFSQGEAGVNGEGQSADYFSLFSAHVNKLSTHGDEIRGCCPFHDDHSPSWNGKRVTGLWKCHGCGAHGNAQQFAERVGERGKENGPQQRKIVATYNYTDEASLLLYQSVRYEPKDFRQRRPDGKGGWFWNLKDTRLVLYHLPEILQVETVFICEGEKDADRLRSLGLVATSNSGGAGKWREEYNQYLADKHAVILPDNDAPGEAHALQVARSLLPVAATGKIVRLSGLPTKGDVSDWLDSGHTKEELLAIVEATPILKTDETKSKTQERDNLKSAIRRTILDGELKGFDKKRHVADSIRQHFLEHGAFYRTSDNRLFFFSTEERRLYDLEQRQFCHLLIEESGLSTTETFFNFAFDTLVAHVARQGQLVEVHTLAYYDVHSQVLVVSDGGGGIWRRERKGKWESGKNGDNNILFLTESETSPWSPNFESQGTLPWLLEQINFFSTPLSVEDQRTFFFIWLLHQFFPALRRTRTIPAWLGPQGSGKSTACRLIGRFLLGESFDVSGLRKEKEDAFVAAITNRVLYALDNADTRIDWLEDALARYATGEVFRLRRLYTTNDEVSYRARAILMLTSRNPHFQRADVSQRLLPFHLQQIEEFQDEPTIFAELHKRRNALWGELLTELAEAQDALESAAVPKFSLRMADYAAFGWQVFSVQKKEREWIEALQRLDAAQMRFAAEGDGMVMALGILMDGNEQLGPFSVRELYAKVADVADANSLAIPKTTEWFGRKLTSQKRVIESELNVTLLDERGHERKRTITIKKKKV